MNDYFGSLLRQTGIAIGRQPEKRSPLSAEPHLRPEASETSQAFEIEEHREVVRSSMPQQGTDQPSEIQQHQTLVVPPEPESVDNIVHEAPRFISRETAAAANPPSNKKQQDELTAPERPGKPVTTPTASAVGSEKMLPSSDTPEKATSPRPIENNLKGKRQIAEFSSSPRVQTQANRSTPPTETHTTDKMARLVVSEEAWKTAYKQVREWVAKQPVQTTEIQHDQIAGKAVEVMRKEIQTKLQARAVPRANNREGRSSTAAEREEIQHLYLSIGKIEISLEQPHQQGRRSAQAADRIAPKPAPERPSSRLRRHYLVP